MRTKRLPRLVKYLKEESDLFRFESKKYTAQKNETLAMVAFRLPALDDTGLDYRFAWGLRDEVLGPPVVLILTGREDKEGHMSCYYFRKKNGLHVTLQDFALGSLQYPEDVYRVTE